MDSTLFEDIENVLAWQHQAPWRQKFMIAYLNLTLIQVESVRSDVAAKLRSDIFQFYYLVVFSLPLFLVILTARLL
jgi:hypothetical protein